MRTSRTFGAVLAATTLVVCASAVLFAAIITVPYTGQGFIISEDDPTPVVKDERCGAEGQGTANDGSTGQFANWNGPGEPYQPGQPYLVWVLSLNATPGGGVTLNLPDGPVQMVQVGGTWKYASLYYSYDDLVGTPGNPKVTATFEGAGLKASVLRNVQLVVSHGCAPFEDNGAWCSPGYWKNAKDAAWALTGYAKTDLFNSTVVPNFYDTPYIDALYPLGPTLIQVLTTPGANSFGTASGPFGLNAFNATGAFLTNQVPGYSFDLSRIGDEDACPIDNHGNFKTTP